MIIYQNKDKHLSLSLSQKHLPLCLWKLSLSDLHFLVRSSWKLAQRFPLICAMNKLQKNQKKGKLSQAHWKCKQTYENSYLRNFSWCNPIQTTLHTPTQEAEQDVTSFAAGTDNSQSTLWPTCEAKKKLGGGSERNIFDYLVVVDVAVFHWDAIKYIAVKVSTLPFPLTSGNWSREGERERLEGETCYLCWFALWAHSFCLFAF